MKKFLSKYWVWLLLVLLVVGEVYSFAYLYPYTGADYISLVFGMSGIGALVYLTIANERKQKG
ncbi:hypothetical protein [Alkalihalobacillus sp. TS-13]|uniref:hypothetical protein n=1 Tax=Alkalihalobacillus sp. TS-13 TaxID=2842455 RepID=UPI001C8783EC|nr:hypothetical protein [Alkalihalobacillus sp. TS-13]